MSGQGGDRGSQPPPDAPGGPPADDPVTAKLRGLQTQRERERALKAPRVTGGAGGRRYFVHDCPHCHEEQYHHLDPRPAPERPQDGASWLELAWCEGCGVVERWAFLDGLPDGSTRVLGPDFGPSGPPSAPPSG